MVLSLSAVIELATQLHDGQVDKEGQPYIGHLARVAQRVEYAGGSPEQVQAAWLHDSIEDTAATKESLLAQGVSLSVVMLVDVLTKKPGQSYDSFITWVASDAEAAFVKRYDIADNLDPTRLDKLDPETQLRLAKKYAQALLILAR